MVKNPAYIGIDGGGTRGRIIVADVLGNVIAQTETGSLNISNSTIDSVVQNLTSGFKQICGQLGGDFQIAGIGAGVAGIKEAEDCRMVKELVAKVFQVSEDKVEAVNDVIILQSASLVDKQGVSLILGTGSHCAGQDADGETITCGGWGYILDDCGGGYSIGHEALRTATRMWDGRLETTGLAARVCEYLNISHPEQSLKSVHAPSFGFDQIKALAPIVTALAAAGDKAAIEILRSSVEDAAQLVVTVCRKLQLGSSPVVIVTGGVVSDPLVRQMLLEALRLSLPGVRLTDPTLPPVAGGVIRAAINNGCMISEDFLDRLELGTRKFT